MLACRPLIGSIEAITLKSQAHTVCSKHACTFPLAQYTWNWTASAEIASTIALASISGVKDIQRAYETVLDYCIVSLCRQRGGNDGRRAAKPSLIDHILRRGRFGRNRRNSFAEVLKLLLVVSGLKDQRSPWRDPATENRPRKISWHIPSCEWCYEVLCYNP